MKINSKILFFILSTTLLVYGVSIAIITIRSNNMAIANARTIADAYARENANLISSKLNIDMGVARAISHSFIGYETYLAEQRKFFYQNILKKIFVENNEFLAVWASWELSAIDPEYNKEHGRERTNIFNIGGTIITDLDTLDTGEQISVLYSKIKQGGIETITEPYKYQYLTGDTVLETSICAQIISEGKYVGLAGVDVPLHRFQEITDRIKPFDESYAFIIAHDGTIVAHPKPIQVGKKITEVEPEMAAKHKLMNKISEGADFSFIDNERSRNATYYTYAPITVGNSHNTWFIGIQVPIKIIMHDANTSRTIFIAIGFVGLLILAVVIALLSRNITHPLILTTNVLNDLAQGKIDKTKKLNVKSSDEIGEMALSVNTLIDGLNRTTTFANEIGEGNLDANFSLLSDEDVLGNALLEMRKSLKIAAEEEAKRKIDDLKQNWATKGYALFGEALRQHNDNINDFSYNVLSNLVKYIEGVNGVFYITNSENSEEYFEITAAYAYDKKQIIEKRFKIGQTLVGRSIKEHKTLYLDSVPEDYMKIASGLGEHHPRMILIVPLIFNEKCYGAVEISSFKEFEEYKVQFIEKVGESIASTISTIKINIESTRFYRDSLTHSQALKKREEEMNKHLKELEDTQRKMKVLKEEESRKQKEMMQTIEDYREMLIEILNKVSEKIVLKDSNGRILLANNAIAQKYSTTVKEMIGKSDFDLMEYETAKRYREDELEIMQSGSKMFSFTENKGENHFHYKVFKIPFYINHLNQMGILVIQMDISAEINFENRITELESELRKYKY